MTNFISRAEADELCDGLIIEFTGINNKNPNYIDIDKFVRECLKCDIVYESIAEAEKDCIAFASNGKRALKIRVNGTVKDIIYPKDTIVLDKYLLNENERNHRRFILAHEAGHILANRINPDGTVYFHRFTDKERSYTIKDFRERYNFNEWQANVFAESLLMPRYLMIRIIKELNDGRKITVYGDNYFHPREKDLIYNIAKSLQVSFAALVIRLKNLNLLNRRDISEYIKKELQVSNTYNTDKTQISKEITEFRAELSKQEAEEFAERELTCPKCGYLVGYAFSDAQGHFKIKCKKCKEVSVLNFAYFYRDKNRQNRYSN